MIIQDMPPRNNRGNKGKEGRAKTSCAALARLRWKSDYVAVGKNSGAATGVRLRPYSPFDG